MNDLLHGPDPDDVLPDPTPHQEPAGMEEKDYDGGIYEENFQAADHRPVDYTGLVHEEKEIPSTNRLLSRRLPVGTNGGVVFDPVLIFPSDPKRKQLLIWLDGNTANTDYALVAEAKSEVIAAVPTCSRVYQQNGVVTLEDYTGPVWIYSPSVNSIGVNVCAVSE